MTAGDLQRLTNGIFWKNAYSADYGVMGNNSLQGFL